MALHQIGRRWMSLIFSILFLIGMTGSYKFSVCADSAEAVPAVSIGDGFAVALTAEGIAWSWGTNTVGQLGNGTASTAYQTTPVRVSGTQTFVAVSAGTAHVLALDADGNVWSWGENGSGQLGLGDSQNRHVPTKIPLFSTSKVVEIAAGGYTSFARTVDGSVFAWGNNQTRMLGDASLTELEIADAPMLVSELSDLFITHIAAGEATVAAIASDGSVWLWGENGYQQAGVSASSEDVATPTQKLFSVSYLAQDVVFGDTHTSVLCIDGSLIGFGLNQYGQFGNNKTTDTPTTAKNNTQNYMATFGSQVRITAVAAGSTHMVAMSATGDVYTWGSNRNGQLGGNPENTKVPSAVDFSQEDYAVSVAAGYENTALIDSEGHLYMWGSNSTGQLGNGGTTDSDVPVAVKGENGTGSLYLGLSSTKVTANTYVTANATVPSPTFQISIPASVNMGTLEQKSETAENKIATAKIQVGASGISYLFGRKIVVRIAPSLGDDFVLTGEDGSTLPYSVYATESGGSAMQSNTVFAEFTESGSVKGRIEIDQSDIEQSDTYRGTLTFYVSLEEPNS